MMEPPKGRVGKLLHHIMTNMPEMPVAKYNRIYGAVLDGLQSAEQVGVMICPDNDQAFWARYCALPRRHKRALARLMDDLAREQADG